MLISHQYKFIFVHIQKTGGLTVEDILERQVPDLQKVIGRHALAQHGIDTIPEWNDYFKFAFVRNPWDRLVSWYSMIKNAGDLTLWEALTNANKRRDYLSVHVPGRHKFWQYILKNSKSFDEFLLNCAEPFEVKPGLTFSIYRNQMDYLSDQNGKLAVDYVGRFENFVPDLTTALEKIGVSAGAIPHKNPSKHKHYSAYYSPQMRDLVAEKYARDLAAFDYRFESQA